MICKCVCECAIGIVDRWITRITSVFTNPRRELCTKKLNAQINNLRLHSMSASINQ